MIFDSVQIPEGGFKTILADPPWKYSKWGAASVAPRGSKYKPTVNTPMPYKTMSVSQICQLPVRSLAADNCELYLWTTQKYLPASFSVIEAWGFKYCQILTWVKTPKGTGQGGMYCPTTEFLLLARVGKMPAKKRRDSTWFHVKRPMRHSQKPEAFQDLIEMQTDGPRIELFARRVRDGWTAWGDEIDQSTAPYITPTPDPAQPVPEQ